MPSSPTPNPSSDVTIFDNPTPPDPVKPRPLLADLFGRYKTWMSTQPWYYHLLAVVLAMVVGALVKHYYPAAAPFVPSPADVAKQPPSSAEEAQPHLVAAWADDVAADRHKIAAEHFRRLASHRLQEDGFALIGGPKTPLKPCCANRLVGKLSDAAVIENARAVGFDPVGDDGGLGFFARLAKWVKDHPEQVQAILKILLTILLAFGEPVAVQVELLDGGGVCVTATYPDFVVVCWA